MERDRISVIFEAEADAILAKNEIPVELLVIAGLVANVGLIPDRVPLDLEWLVRRVEMRLRTAKNGRPRRVVR